MNDQTEAFLEVGTKVITPIGTGIVEALGDDELLFRNEALVKVDGQESKSIFLRSQLLVVEPVQQ